MSDLARFQSDFLRALAQPAAQAEPGPLTIYRNTSLSGALEALADNFPVVRAILGEAMFRSIALDYALAQPPNSPVLALYGRRFADWIAAEPWSARLPYLADVARIERLHLEALFSADGPPLPADALAALAPNDWAVTRLALHPAVRCHWSPLPAMSLWLAHQQPTTPGEIAPEWRAEGALFTRPWSTVEAHVLDAPAYAFLGALRRGEPVGAAALLIAERHPDADIGGLFQTFLAAGVFADVVPPAPTLSEGDKP